MLIIGLINKIKSCLVFPDIIIIAVCVFSDHTIKRVFVHIYQHVQTEEFYCIQS